MAPIKKNMAMVDGGESPETLLTRLSSKEVFKAAKETSRTGIRICGTRQENGGVTAVFRMEKTGEDVTVYARATKKAATSICSMCGEKVKTLCPHGFAALLYDMKYIPVRSADVEQTEVKYQGLQVFDYATLASKTGTHQAWLRVDAETDFPHIPSKWEKAVFIITMNVNGKLYKGNIANIRQLHFDKPLAMMKSSDFSLHERQILRYFAVNAEADNARLMLDSEQTAELFHCLIDFPRFYQSGQRIVVHSEPAAPVLLVSPVRADGTQKIQSGLLLGEALMPLEAPRVITGRNGVWVGARGEYWWVGGTLDVTWLRSFFRNSPRELPVQEAETLIAEIASAPVEVRNFRGMRSVVRHPDILLDSAYPNDDEFHLFVRFCYDDAVYGADQARFAVGERKVSRRDNALESAFIDRLRYFGFTQPTRNPSFFSLSPEAVPMFASDELAALDAEFPRLHLSPQLVRLSHPDMVAVRFDFKRADNDFFYVESCFTAGSSTEPIYWKTLSLHVSQGRRTIRFSDTRYVRMPENLFRFLAAVMPIMLPVKGHDDTFRIARANVPFWTEQGKDVPGVVPREFLLMTEKLDHIELDDEIIGVTHEFTGTLRPYQQFGVAWLLQRFRNGFNAVLADEMGLGKTVQALAALARYPHPEGKPHLIVCPTSLTENWRREAERFVPGFRVAVAQGPTRSILWSDTESYDLMIVSYAVARRDIEELQKRAFTVVVLDEAQHIKNPSTVNAKTCKAIPSQRRLVLTGTPLENSHEDLWSIFDFLHPNMLGPQAMFVRQHDLIHNPDAAQNLTLLAARLAPFMLRRRKNEVCEELPPKTEQTIFCNMLNGQHALYEQYRLTGQRQCAELDQKKISRFDILATLMRLRQICCHPALLPDVDVSENIPSAKMELFLEVLSQNIDSGHKVLVFSQFTSLLAHIKTHLDELGVTYEYLDGHTKDRQERVDHFNNSPEVQVFLLSLKAGGTGFNLTAADTVILYDPWWNPAVENQAADRTHRIGQDKPVSILRLVMENSIEERILSLQARKQDLFNKLVEDPTRDAELHHLSEEDLKFLLS